MMNLATMVGKFRHDAPPAAVEPLDALLAERDRAAIALGRFGRFDEAIGAAHEAREAARDALRALVASETQQLAAWAQGDQGEAPSRDTTRGAALTAEIEQAERDHDAAVAARATIEPAHARARMALHAVHVRLDEHRAEKIVAEALDEVDALARIVADARVRFARIMAAKEALYEQGRQHRSRGDLGREAPWTVAGNRLADVAPVMIEAGPQAIQTHVAAWRGKISGGEIL